jgi:hypothetical protein
MDAYSPCRNLRPNLQRPRGARSHNRWACVAEKRSLTNRIRGQFARIKAAGPHRYQLWLLRKTRSPGQIATGPRRGGKSASTIDGIEKKSGNQELESQDISERKVRTFRSRRSGHFRVESQDISKPKVRTRPGRRPGRSCRRPCQHLPRQDCGNGAPVRHRPPARRCDRPAGPSARRD